MIALNKLTEIKYWMHRNAREVELSLWNYFFENGSRRDVADALSWYQNEDGGFGYALDADNWNPDSNPYQTSMAIRILRNIGFTDMEHPVCQGIFRYLYSEKDLMDYGWGVCLPPQDKFSLHIFPMRPGGSMMKRGILWKASVPPATLRRLS